MLGEFLDLLDVVLTAVSVLNGSIDIGGRTDVRVIQHGDHRQDYALNAQDWSPSLVGSLSRVKLVSARGMQDRYADLTIGVDYTH